MYSARSMVRCILPFAGKQEKIRKDGRWKNLLSRVRSPVYVIHGEMDPHPLEGVIEPLFRANIKFRKTYYHSMRSFAF